MNDEQNPYAAPEAEVFSAEQAAGRTVLAGRLNRLGAVLLDGLIGALPAGLIVPFYIAILGGDEPGGTAMALLAVGAVLSIGLLIIQLVLLAQNGWTIGKRILGIRIVRTTGEKAGLGRIFWLRMVIPGVIGVIPFIGPLFSLVDPLFIFSEPRRCIHDHIADTIVIEA